ncbi:MAG: hypothetical protein ABIG60_02795 [Patescibacteria group bacterium]
MKFLANVKIIFVILFSLALFLSCLDKENAAEVKFDDKYQSPKIVSIDIEPKAPEEGDDILCTVKLFDSDPNWKQIEFIWTVKNEIVYSYVIYITDITSPNIECESILDYYEADLKPGVRVKCEVTVKDQKGQRDKKEIFVLIKFKELKNYSE